MKIISLAITLLGILFLLIILNFSSPKIIDSSLSLQNLPENTKIQTQGKLISERTLNENTNLMKLDNDIEIICINCPKYLNQTIKLTGIIEKYQNRTQIKLLRITSNVS